MTAKKTDEEKAEAAEAKAQEKKAEVDDTVEVIDFEKYNKEGR